MSDKPSLCWKCKRREYCNAFKKMPDANVTNCNRFEMNEFTRKMVEVFKEIKKEAE